MKKLFAAIISAFFAITLTACSSVTEIDQRSIVHAVGVDLEEGEYKVSLQIFAPSGSGGDTPVDVSKSNTRVVSAKGKTIYEGVKGCEKLLGGEAFMGHNKFILFGSSLYGEDMEKLLDWFSKENENYLGVAIGFCEESAEEILNINLTDGASAVENMELVYENAAKNGSSPESDLLTLLNDMLLTTKSSVLPVFTLREKKNEQGGESPQEGSGEGSSGQPEQYLEINKAVVLRDGVAAGFISEEEIAGVLWLTGKLEKTSAAIEYEGKAFSVELENEGVVSTVDIENGRLVLDCRIYAKATAVENLKSDIKKNICRLSQEKILKDCQKAVDKTLGELGADVLRIEKLMKFYEPSAFRRYSKSFPQLLTSVEVRAEVVCKMGN